MNVWHRSGVQMMAVLLVLLGFFAGNAFSQGAKPLKGIALVIGQSNYGHLPKLTNPLNDSRTLASLFGNLGFNVTAVADRDARKLRRDVENFVDDAEGADVAVVYYSGHGIEAAGENWLVPTDADVTAPSDPRKTLVPLSALLDELQAKVPLTLVFLDACRTNPFPASVVLKDSGSDFHISAGGLSPTKGAIVIEAEKAAQGLGAVIGFAAEPGMVALDGPADGNSPYAAALLRHLSASTGAEFGTVMRLVTEEVYLKTQGRQRPWINETLTKLLYFGGKPEDLSSDDGELNAGRRALLLSISALPQETRQNVEALARNDGLSLDTLYGMLRELEVNTSAGPQELDKQLRAGAEAVRQLRERRDAIQRTDPQIVHFTELADRAEDEGAIPLAQQYRAKASAVAEKLSRSLKEEDAQLKARHSEVAATFAREGATAMVAFDYRKAADQYARAVAEISTLDPTLARAYRWSQADALGYLGLYRGDNTALGEAITTYREALAQAPPEPDKTKLAKLQGSLGVALSHLGEHASDTSTLDEAVKALQAAQYDTRQQDAPRDWASTQKDLGLALATIGMRTGDRAKLQRAIDAYDAALDVLSRQASPFDWGSIEASRGMTLFALGVGEPGIGRLEEAVAAYRIALEEVTRDRGSFQWAAVKAALGLTLTVVASRQGNTALLDEARQAYDDALTVYRRDIVPMYWALIQATTAALLVTSDEIQNDEGKLTEAVQRYHAAFEEMTKERSAYDWGIYQSNMSYALWRLGMRKNDAGILKEAAGAANAALEVFSYERSPVDWASAQHDLGLAMESLGERETGSDGLEAAIAAFRAALNVRSQAKDASGWAFSESNLGLALATLGRRKADTAMVQEGLASMQAAQKAFDEIKNTGQVKYLQRRIDEFEPMANSPGK